MVNDLSAVRSNRKRNAKRIFLSAALIILGVLALFVFTARDEVQRDKQFTFEANSERVEFLNKQGLIVEPEPQREKITVPEEFNAAFTEYNELQKQQGFDLEPYKGKEVTKYTYTVLSFPDYPENVTANLLFDDHLMIAADITYNDAENGFTQELLKEKP